MILENRTEPMLILPKSRMAKDRIYLVLNIIFIILSVAVLAVGFWWYLTVKWGARTWSNLQIQEMLYTLLMPLEGTDTDMVADHINSCVIPAAIAGAAALLILILIFRKRTLLHVLEIAAIAAGISFAVVGFANMWDVMDLSEYMAGQEEYSSFVDENYADPGAIELSFPAEKRNLIYIFLESVENTFADESVGGDFEKNVIPELTRISLENENFSGNHSSLNGGHAMTGATWTVGAMFAQTSGLPLLISISNNSMSLQDEFFPGVKNLGDILEEEGYHQVAMMGSDATFGGRRLLFTQHGNFDIHDYYYFIEQGIIPEDYFVWWGFEDTYLFAEAKKELEELGKSNEPFNFMMLTVDTHFEDGYVCSICGDEFDDQYSNVYACSSKQVADFVDWIQEQPFYENTTVVIAGDHETMDKDYCDRVSGNYDRTVYFTVLNSAVEPEVSRERKYTTFDYFPTTLAAMGVEIPGDRLGLGTNLFSEEPTLYELYGKNLFNQGLSSKSELMERLTAGITTDYAQLEVGAFDEKTQSIEIRAVDVNLPESQYGISIIVWPDGYDDEKKEYMGEKITDKEYVFNVPITDFYTRHGEFHVHLYSKGLNRDQFLRNTTMMINGPDSGEETSVYLTASEPEMEISAFDYATGTMKVDMLNVPNDVVSLNLAVWTAADQSDLRWYEMQPADENVFTTTISIEDFGLIGLKYHFHAYAININGDNKLIEANSLLIE